MTKFLIIRFSSIGDLINVWISSMALKIISLIQKYIGLREKTWPLFFIWTKESIRFGNSIRKAA